MIISNSTPLIHLTRIGWLELLKKEFKRVIIPKTVFSEVVIRGEEQGYLDAKIIRKATEEWIEVKELSKKESKNLDEILSMAPVGKAEAESIVLAKNMKLPLLIDDLIGQRIARIYKVKTYWTTSVILKAFSDGVITKTQAKKIIEDLITSELRIKPKVLIELMKKLS